MPKEAPANVRAAGPQRLLSAADVARIDAAAAALDKSGGLAALMDRAGAATAECAERRFGDRSGAAVVLAGPGNNGGDGSVAAKRLLAAGRSVVLVLLGEPAQGGIAHDALEAFRAAGGEVLASGADVGRLRGAAYIVDALFGVGLTRPLAGEAAALVEAANSASAAPGGPPILAVDLPSGVAADTGAALGPAIQAQATISFIGPKRGHLIGEGALLSGDLEIADIGAPQEAMGGWTEDVFENAPALFPQGLGKRAAAHKYDHGSVLVATGGMGATGAARLAARAALRVGAGLVTAAAPGSAMLECACHLTAAMLRPAETAADFSKLLEDRRINAVLIGPGHARHRLGSERTREFVQATLATDSFIEGDRAVVLDADALTCWPDPELMFEALRGGRAVLTPHGGEFARLFPDLAKQMAEPSEVASYGKIEACREAAARSGAVVLLKGFDTVIAAPDGRVAVQCAARERAAPWLATAGSGDVLAGIIAGLLARGFPPFEAASAGAWAHLEAGRVAGPGLIAEDLPEALRRVLAEAT